MNNKGHSDLSSLFFLLLLIAIACGLFELLLASVTIYFLVKQNWSYIIFSGAVFLAWSYVLFAVIFPKIGIKLW